MWGTNHNDMSAKTEKPVRIPALSGLNLVALVGGSTHVLAADDKHRYFSWGYDHSGQLGLGDTDIRTQPTLIPAIQNLPCKILHSGGQSSYLATKQNELWCWGKNSEGQLGLEVISNQLIPKRAKFFLPIAALAAQYDCLFILTEQHELYYCGCPPQDLTEVRIGIPTKVTRFDGVSVKSITCGLHSLLLSTMDNKVYSYGLDAITEKGQVLLDEPWAEFRVFAGAYSHYVIVETKRTMHTKLKQLQEQRKFTDLIVDSAL